LQTFTVLLLQCVGFYVNVLLQLLDPDVKCPKYDKARNEVYERDWVRKMEQRNKVSHSAFHFSDRYIP